MPHSHLWPVAVQSLGRVWLFATPWTAAQQASPSFASSRSPPTLMSTESVMPSNHLILCRPLLLLPAIFPSVRVFSNESALCIRWPEYRSYLQKALEIHSLFTTSPPLSGPFIFLSCGMTVVTSKEVSLFLLLLVLWDFLHSAAGINFKTVHRLHHPLLSHALPCAICLLHPWNTLPPLTAQHVHGSPDQQKRLGLFMLSGSFLTGKVRTRIFVLFFGCAMWACVILNFLIRDWT